MYDKAESTKKLKIRFSINGVPSIFTILKFKCVVDNSKFLVPPTSFYDGSTAGLDDSLLVMWEEKKVNLAELPLKCKYTALATLRPFGFVEMCLVAVISGTITMQ